MFFTSIGFSLDMHYCQDEIQSISVFGKAKSCDKLANHHCDQTTRSCHKSNKNNNSALSSCDSQISGNECDRDCCHNKSIQLENLDENSLSASYISLELNQIQFVLAFVSSFYYPTIFKELRVTEFSKYRPPLIERDLQLLFQSYLL